jgi:hypothetical protein
MMTLARPPDRWEPETTTAEALVTLRPAVGPVVGSMVNRARRAPVARRAADLQP